MKSSREQIDKAREHIRAASAVSHQRRLNFEMSVRNLMQSFQDRDVDVRRAQRGQQILNAAFLKR